MKKLTFRAWFKTAKNQICRKPSGSTQEPPNSLLSHSPSHSEPFWAWIPKILVPIKTYPLALCRSVARVKMQGMQGNADSNTSVILGSDGSVGSVGSVGSMIQDPGYPGSWIIDPGFWIIDPGSWIIDPGSGINDPGSCPFWRLTKPFCVCVPLDYWSKEAPLGNSFFNRPPRIFFKPSLTIT